MAITVKELRIILSLTERSLKLPVLRTLPPRPAAVVTEYEPVPDDALEIYGLSLYGHSPVLLLQHPEEAVLPTPLTPAALYHLLSPFDDLWRIAVLPPQARDPVEVHQWIVLTNDSARPETRLALVLPQTPV